MRKHCSPGPADIVFVVDTSSSLENKTNKCLEYMGTILDRLPLGNDGFQVAVISYDFEPKELIKLKQYKNAEDIKNVVTGINSKTQGATYTENALRKSVEILTDENSTQKAHKIIVIISDGLSTDRDAAIKAAERFRMWPYHVIITIGIGEAIDHFELLQLASKDQKNIYGPLVFSSSNDEAINMILREAMHKDCTNCSISNNTDVIIIQDNNFSGVDFKNSLSVASEIALKYFLTKKDVRVGRISFDIDDFAYYSHDEQFLVSLQKLNPGKKSESNIESLLSEAAVQLLSSGVSSGVSSGAKRHKVIVIITDGHWSKVSRVEDKIGDLSRQNITTMIVAVTKDSNFTTLYRVVQDPFYVFYINEKKRWNIIDIIVSQSFSVNCEL
ncbi:collagen alpha-3(VI) chain-like [Saccostrea cucullata]|uniref:collagen alpha-3(VI) chain-like n=1 Tax=Saccostrea cuccullata TaxID=36930 RepID=UPI002ECFC4A0